MLYFSTISYIYNTSLPPFLPVNLPPILSFLIFYLFETERGWGAGTEGEEEAASLLSREPRGLSPTTLRSEAEPKADT